MNCENCIFWYSETSGSLAFCHGTTKEDCECGQKVDPVTALCLAHGLTFQRIERFKELRANPEIQKVMEEIEKNLKNSY